MGPATPYASFPEALPTQLLSQIGFAGSLTSSFTGCSFD